MAGDKYAALRAEYVTGTMTQRQLAEAHGVSYRAVQKAAERQGWEAQRREKAEKVAKKAEKRAVDRCAQWIEDDIKAAVALRLRSYQRLNALADPEQTRGTELAALGNAIAKASNIGRISLGLNTESIAHELSGGLSLAQVEQAQLDAMMRDVMKE